MKNFYNKVKGKVLAVGAAVLACPAVSFAAAQDYTGVDTAVRAEITAVVPIALGVLAMTIGIPMAISVFKRVAR